MSEVMPGNNSTLSNSHLETSQNDSIEEKQKEE